MGLSTQADVSTGTSLAVLGDGTVKGWGRNNWGQTGIGNTTPNPVLTPTAGSGLTSVISVATGGDHGLALKSDGSVWAWGYNVYGQLGNNASGFSTPVLTPVQVKTGPSTNLTNAVAIAAGLYFSVALKSDGTVVAFRRLWPKARESRRAALWTALCATGLLRGPRVEAVNRGSGGFGGVLGA